MWLSIFIFGLLSCLLYPFVPTRPHQRIVTLGNAFIVLWLRVTCGVRVNLVGAENLPDSPAVVLSNHESTWETFYLQRLLAPVSTTLKKELLRIPFFGWGLYFMRPIAIDRGNPRAALRQVLETGKQRIAEGNNVLIYPEGTRHGGGKKQFARSGAAIAVESGVPVIPVAHNAGDHWPGRTFIKRPGTITVVVGTPIFNPGQDSRSVTSEVQQWIESQRASMGG
ncbi:MAG: lysophospholipid acyltransferase family protein [bacterium]